jgi:two-component system nitrate/nitrite response regulator NarL
MMKTKRRKIKVFLVDDHPVVRAGVRLYLRTQGAIAVVGEAAGDAEALRKLKKCTADVVVLDVNLPVSDGGELARKLRVLLPRVKFVAFSIHAGPEYMLRMARCGVQGYVTKDAPPARLVEAIQRVHAGGLHFPPGMIDAIKAPGVKPYTGEAQAPLTAREKQVLALLAEGLANKEVARKLGISVRTAETHREHLSRKLGIASVAGLTRYAIVQGLSPLRSSPPD